MKKILIFILILAALGGAYAMYLYYKPVSDTGHVKPEYVLSAGQLFDEFENNEPEANSRYLGKVIQVNGVIKDISIGDGGELNVIMATTSEMFGISCGLSKGQETQYKQYQVGDSIRIKGECTGISLDVVLTRCVIVNE